MQKSKAGAEKTEKTNCPIIITRSAAAEAARAYVQCVPSSSEMQSNVATISLSVPRLPLPSCYVALEKLPAANSEPRIIKIKKLSPPEKPSTSVSPSIVIPSSSSSNSNLAVSSSQNQSETETTASSMNFKDKCADHGSSPGMGYLRTVIRTEEETTTNYESTQTKSCKRAGSKEFVEFACNTAREGIPWIYEESDTAKRRLLDKFENFFQPPESECAIIRAESNGSITSVWVPFSGNGMDAFVFSCLIQVAQKETSKKPKVLLLDCRSAESFNCSGRVKFSPCVNVDIPSSQISITDKFSTKVSVIKFFQKTCPKVLRYLNSPDHYTDIIVFDEKSTTNEPSAVTTVVIAAIKKTENTGTNVKLLQGGIRTMCGALLDRIVTPETGKLAKDSQILFKVREGVPLEAETVTQVEKYLVYYDSAISSSKDIIDLRKQMTCLENVKRVLLEDDKNKLTLELDAQFPKNVKCATCTKVFIGEIIQCANGHCICAECCDKISVCPQCNISYYSVGISIGKVRNRGLEGLMKSTLTVKCHCGKDLKCTEILSHVNECVNGLLMTDEVFKMKDEIELIKGGIRVEMKKLEDVKKLIADVEQYWCATNDYIGRHAKIGQNERKIIMERIHEKQICLSTLKTTLLSLALFDEEYNIQEKKGGYEK